MMVRIQVIVGLNVFSIIKLVTCFARDEVLV